MDDTTRAVGTLYGLACGDALGRPVEGYPRERIERERGHLTEMIGRGVHGQPPGTVTDDTDLALCIARSLVETGRFDGQDVAERFLAWYENDPVGIGALTADSIRAFQRGESWRDAGRVVWQQRPEGQNAGNGSVMRCAPYAIAFRDDPDALVRVSRQSSSITHADPRCTYGCAVLNGTIAGMFRAEDDPLAGALARVERDAPPELAETLRLVPDYVTREALPTTAYVVDTLQTALTVGLTADSAEAAIVEAVNLGGDTDTIGAVTGAIAGARFGAEAIPDRWLAELSVPEELRVLGTALATTDIRR
jgi:ADP-ribosyl-[dinitrogen reductase] hydrolase